MVRFILKYCRYKVYMSNIINENLLRAQRGGVPGTYPLVRSFVGIRLQGDYLGLQDGQIDDRPLWPMVYYCLRSGDLAAALHCLRSSRYLREVSNFKHFSVIQFSASIVKI